jgi:Fur family zinc uptake transcriptional regulator
VLEIVWAQREPSGAYDILRQVPSASGKAVPITIYRVLELLIDAGLVYRIYALNACKGCDSPEHQHRAQFRVRRACRRGEERDDVAIESAIDARAA